MTDFKCPVSARELKAFTSASTTGYVKDSALTVKIQIAGQITIAM